MRVATKEGVIEMEGDPNLNPLIWPVCNVCDVPYVLRRSLSLSKGYGWFWLNDCAKPRSTCKSAGASMHDYEGEVPAGGR
mgnify:CR=1 FL=1